MVPAEVVEDAATADTTSGVVPLSTVTVTAAEVATLPAASRATAVSACGPSGTAVVSQPSVYGAALTSSPSGAPSSWNCTPITPTLSLALAPTVTRPATVAPAAGPAIATVRP